MDNYGGLRHDKRMRMVRIKGHLLPLQSVAKVFIQAWEQREKLHLQNLMFRIPIIYDTVNGFTYVHDHNLLLTNKLVYRILKMPKVGIRINFSDAIDKRGDACFDASGELVSFEPCDQDIVEWALERGYYIDFDELEILECRVA
jgi:hypothetical protein